MGHRTIIARYVAKWGIAQICLCDVKYQRGVSQHFGVVLASLKKYRAIWGISAIVSQCPRDMGPLSPLLRRQFGIEIGSNQEINVKPMSNRCQIKT